VPLPPEGAGLFTANGVETVCPTHSVKVFEPFIPPAFNPGLTVSVAEFDTTVEVPPQVLVTTTV
jgi:hypothetical protein